MACLVDLGTSFDTPGTPGGASIVEIQEFLDLFLIFLADSATWRIFFIILKLKPDVTSIDLTRIKVTISLASETSCECCYLKGIRANKSSLGRLTVLIVFLSPFFLPSRQSEEKHEEASVPIF